MGNPLSDLTFHDRPIHGWLDDLERGDIAERRAAAAAWRSIGAPLKSAVQHLVAVLKDHDLDVRREAIRTLASLGEQAHYIALTLRIALKASAMRDPDEAVRDEAVQGLIQIGPQTRTPLPALVEGLHDELVAVRFGAANALGELGPEARPAVGALIHSLRDANAGVRVEAARALWKIDRRDRIAVPILIEALEGPDEVLRWIAADSLGEIGPEARDAIPALEKAIRGNIRASMIRKGMLLALERIDPQAAERMGVS